MTRYRIGLRGLGKKLASRASGETLFLFLMPMTSDSKAIALLRLAYSALASFTSRREEYCPNSDYFHTDQLTRLTSHAPSRFCNIHKWLPRSCLEPDCSAEENVVL